MRAATPCALLLAASLCAQLHGSREGEGTVGALASSLRAVESVTDNAGPAAAIVTGLTESFLAGRGVGASATELDCLASGVGRLAGGIVDTCRQTVVTLHRYMGAPAGQKPDPLIAGMEIAERLSLMMAFEHRLAESCLRNESVAALTAAAHHLGNLTFIGGRILTNGLDIATDLDKAIGFFETGDYRNFGFCVGRSWHKVLLSTGGSNVDAALDMKLSPEEVEEATDGLMSSLFGPNMQMQILVDAAPPSFLRPTDPQAVGPMSPSAKAAPSAEDVLGGRVGPSLSALSPAARIDVDLHTCVTQNRQRLTAAWAPVWQVVQQALLAGPSGAAAEGHGFDDIDDLLACEHGICVSLDGLATAMFDVQAVLGSCLGEAGEAVLIDALEAGRGVHAGFRLVGEPALGEEAKAGVARAMAAWRQRRWGDFGARLGEMLRRLLLAAFPQKYVVIDNSVLRRQALGLSEQWGSGPRVAWSTPAASVAPRAVFMVLPLLLLAVASLLLAKLRRAHRPHPNYTGLDPLGQTFDGHAGNQQVRVEDVLELA